MLILCGTISPPANAWETKSRNEESVALDNPIAFEVNSRGETSEVFRDADDKVNLRVSLVTGFSQYSPHNCPTLQIDSRVPVHHETPGDNCAIEMHAATIVLGDIVDELIISLPLHRLMNGSQLAVRFVTASGEYRESLFSLSNSKQAIQAAIGESVKAEPRLEETAAQ
ncbi:MAG: hypothetical protein AAF384_19515 [Pseudomonadota bacterium]